MRALILLLAIAACDDDSGTSSQSTMDLSSSAGDLSTPSECAGADVGKPIPCSSTDVCYPDNFTYCQCRAGSWTCCGDNLPICPSTPATPGDFCCPGSPGGPTSELDCPYACTGGSRVVCSCLNDFSWHCAMESCSDAGT